MCYVVLLALGFAGDDGLMQDNHRNGAITFPYVASPKRERQIREGFRRIKVGSTRADVKGILGSPDEITPLYEPKKRKPKQIGTHLWYYIEKPSKDDNINAKLVRVSLDLEDKVLRVSHWGFSEGTGGR